MGWCPGYLGWSCPEPLTVTFEVPHSRVLLTQQETPHSIAVILSYNTKPCVVVFLLLFAFIQEDV